MIRKKKWLLFASACMLILISAFYLLFVDNHRIAYRTITPQKLEKLQENTTKAEEINFDLTFNGERLPLDEESKTFYLPLEMTKEWEEGEIGTEDAALTLFFLEDFVIEDKLSLIKENRGIPFVVCGENSYSVYYLKITGVPIAEFYSTEAVSEEGLAIFGFSLYDYGSKKDWVERCYTTSELHGNTSLAYEKKSLRLKLLQEKDGRFQKYHADLLGLRKDNDWILNGLYADESRIRDKLCIDLWNEVGAGSNPFGKSFGTDGEYVEVFINNHYQGLYLLMYPIDRKQLGMEAVSHQLAKGDTWIERIYKKKYTALWQESDFTGEMPDENMPDYRGGFYLKGDTVLGDLSEWEPLRELAACIESDDNTFRDRITSIVDEQNVIENWLFYQAIAGFDNQAKNMYYAVRRQDGGLKGYFIPWDLNISFGVVYADNAYYCERDASTITQPVLWEPGKRLVELDAKEGTALAAETWQRWRKGAFSDELLAERIASLESFVKDSGAFLRETERWQEGNCNPDFSLLYDYANQRLEFVDEYVESFRAAR